MDYHDDYGTHHGPCELCLGTGTVECWYGLSVRAVSLNKLRLVNRKTGDTFTAGDKERGYLPYIENPACKCSRGDQFATRMRRAEKGAFVEEPMPRYDESAFCRKVSNDLEEDARAWLATRVTDMPGYSETLADF